jgi:hypothetical protein
MARGWESKDVEAQAEEREAARLAQRVAAGIPKKTPEQQEADRKRASLEMDRRRVQAEMDTTTHPRRREQLAAALKHLDAALACLDPGAVEP